MASERKFVTEKIRRVLLKEYVMSRVSRAGFGGLDVQRTPMGTRVTLTTERPGLVIGRRGEAIKTLTRAIEDDFNFNNPQIEVQEVENPNLNAQVMAEKLASALERGWHFRRAGHSTVRRIMESGARGCQVTVAGKLTGQRHRREKFKSGHIKFCGQAKLDFMERGFANARMKPGVIGVTVQIMHPDARLPDEIDVLPLPEPETVPAEPTPKEEDLAEKAQEERAAEAVEELKKASAEDEGKEKDKKPAKKTAADKAKKKEDEAEDKPKEKKPRKRATTKRKKADKKEGVELPPKDTKAEPGEEAGKETGSKAAEAPAENVPESAKASERQKKAVAESKPASPEKDAAAEAAKEDAKGEETKEGE
ncbi:MAG: 30S ribosomal protein S3 [Methanobacteriota archaeon]|nr:MAG: 30S ribosomal protein S3 [Euryarchaeota archaeon]